MGQAGYGLTATDRQWFTRRPWKRRFMDLARELEVGTEAVPCPACSQVPVPHDRRRPPGAVGLGARPRRASARLAPDRGRRGRGRGGRRLSEQHGNGRRCLRRSPWRLLWRRSSRPSCSGSPPASRTSGPKRTGRAGRRAPPDPCRRSTPPCGPAAPTRRTHGRKEAEYEASRSSGVLPEEIDQRRCRLCWRMGRETQVELGDAGRRRRLPGRGPRPQRPRRGAGFASAYFSVYRPRQY